MSVPSATRLFRFGVFEADVQNAHLTRKGVRIRLQEQPFRVLTILLERSGQIVTREDLRQQLWPEGTYVDFDGSLNAALKRLRSALDDDPDNPRFIETIPKRGYRFIAPVSREEREKTASSTEDQTITFPSSEKGQRVVAHGFPAPLRVSNSALRITVVLGIPIVVLAGFLAYRLHSRGSSTRAATPAAIKPIPSRRSIAVLGFYNVSAKAEDAWLATALSEMMSTELAAGDKLRLIPSEDVANLRLASPWSQTDTLGQATANRVGMALNSDLLLLGSYTNLGDSAPRQMRVDVRLQDARSGEILMEVAESGGGQNLFELASRIGGRVRDKLGVPNLQAEDQTSVFTTMPSNREAARFYSLGLQEFHQFDSLAAAELLEQSVKADPNFSLSHSVLSNVWQDLGYGQRARDEAQKAMDLSDKLPQTQKLLISGQYYLSVGKMDEAATDYRSLYAFYPDCIDCGLFLSTAQIREGRPQEALETLQSLRKLPSPASDDPRIDYNEQLAVSTYDRPRQYELLETMARKATARGQKLLYARAKLAECGNLLYAGRPAEAMVTCEDSRSVFESLGDRAGVARTLLIQAARQSDAGDQKSSLRTLKQALQISQQLGGVELRAAVRNGMGNTYERMGRLEKAAESFRAARRKFEESGNRSGVSAASGNLGDILSSMAKFREAEESYDEALKIDLDANPAGGCYPLYSIASIRLVMGDLTTANARIDSALKACRVQKVARQNGYALSVFGDILRAEDKLPEAQEKYQEALEIYAKADAQDLMPGMRMGLASLLLEEGHVAEAEAVLHDMPSALEERKDPVGTRNALVLLSRALQMQGKLDDARKSLFRAKQLSREPYDWALATNLAIADARLTVAAKVSQQKNKEDLGTVRTRLSSSVASMHRIGDYNLECEARLALGELELQTSPSLGRSQLKALAKETRERGFKLVSRKATSLADSASIGR